MKPKLVVCDVDNSVFDSLSRLKDFFPDYEPLEQTTYQFANSEWLQAFADPDFYRVAKFNHSVLAYLVGLRLNGVSLRFVSSSPNDEVHEAKLRLLRSEFGSSVDLDAHPMGAELAYVGQFDKAC